METVTIDKSLSLRVIKTENGHVIVAKCPLQLDENEFIVRSSDISPEKTYSCEGDRPPLTYDDDCRQSLHYIIGKIIDDLAKEVSRGWRTGNGKVYITFEDQKCVRTDKYEKLFQDGMVDTSLQVRCIKDCDVNDPDYIWKKSCKTGRVYHACYFAPWTDDKYAKFKVCNRFFDWDEFFEHFEVLNKGFNGIKELQIDIKR